MISRKNINKDLSEIPIYDPLYHLTDKTIKTIKTRKTKIVQLARNPSGQPQVFDGPAPVMPLLASALPPNQLAS